MAADASFNREQEREGKKGKIAFQRKRVNTIHGLFIL